MKRILPIALAALVLLPGSADAVTRGTVVPESRYPWFADLMGCGGTLVSPTRVVTAAHCLIPMEAFEEITLTLGEAYPGGKRLQVRRHARDPRFASDKRQLMARYDIAVLELAEPVTDVEPVPVAQSDPPAGAAATIIGHGKRRWFGLSKETPKRFVDLTRPLVSGVQEIVADADCRSYYAHNRYKDDFFDSADMICSLDPRSKPSKAAGAPWTSVCMGDSGGPLISRGELVGVVSWSEWCGVRHDPAVFARVSKLRDFVLGEPVWAPVALGVPTVSASGGRLTCVAPAFEGEAEVFGAVWSENGTIVPKLSGVEVQGKPGRRYTCSIRARNAGGSSRSSASAPVTA
jgi:secreted trypsin-like serine protease